MASDISHALLNGIVSILAAQAANLQATLLLLEDASETPVFKIMSTVSRVPTAGNWEGEPVLPKMAITGEYTIPSNSALSYTPTKVHVIGNVGIYQCATEAQLAAILANAGITAPALADVKVGTYDIPAEDIVEYLAGQTISARITLEVSDVTEAPGS